MSARPRISVLRFRQLSTGRFYVPRDQVDQRLGVRKGLEPATRPVELPASPIRLARLRPVSRRGQMVESADELLVVTAETEDVREATGRDEVLATLERALGVPQSGADAALWRGPLVVVVDHAAPS